MTQARPRPRRRTLTTAVAALVGTAVVATLAAAPASAAGDPWGQDPVVHGTYEQSSQGWLGDIPLGATQTTSMTITATQTMRLSPGNWVSRDDEMRLDLVGTCPASLFSSVVMRPGDTCTLNWTFSPARVTSTYTGWNFVTTPLDSSTLQPTGPQEPGAHNVGYSTQVLLADDVDFGETQVGTTVTRPITVRNVSTSDATATFDNPWGDYEIVGREDGPVLVPAGESVTVDVAFTPQAVGARNGSTWMYTLVDVDPGRSTALVRLTGAGVYGTLALRADDVDLGDVVVGTSAERDVVLVNEGTVPAVVEAVDVDALAAAGVEVELDTDSLLAPGESRTAHLTWAPQAAGLEIDESIEVAYTSDGVAPEDAEGTVSVSVVGRSIEEAETPVEPTAPPTESPTDPPTESPTDPATETPTEPTVVPSDGPASPSASEAPLAGDHGPGARNGGGLASTGAAAAGIALVAAALVGLGLVLARRRGAVG